MVFRSKALLVIGIIWMSIVSPNAHAYSGGDVCKINPTWITSPSLPTEVMKSGSDGTSNFCDFYQFSWQSYLYLMSPVSPGSNTRQFQVAANYPLLEFNADGSAANSCDTAITGSTLRAGLDKSFGTHQAGDGAVIFDQAGNAAFFDVRFNKEMCGLTSSAVEMQKNGTINFPAGTTELKFGWKILSSAEVATNTFVTHIPSSGALQGKTLGLIGMHLAIATVDHPEFVWASFEQINNAPNCATASNKAWSFASQQCASTLPGSLTSASCNFNKAENTDKVRSTTPTEICRVFPDGTADGDLKAEENRNDIKSTNDQIAALLNASADPNMKVLKNYFTLGAIWVTQPAVDSTVSNQRGSLRLANPIAETTFQNVNLESSFVSNCFGCHQFTGTSESVNNNITSGSLSHIFFEVITGQGRPVDIQAGPISSNAAAPKICTKTCGNSNLTWNGQWTTTVPAQMSVCGCKQ